MSTFEERGRSRELVFEISDEAKSAQNLEVIGLGFETFFERVITLLQIVVVGVLQVRAATFLATPGNESRTSRQFETKKGARIGGFGPIYEDSPAILRAKS